jgi:hypothetical protein
MAGRDEEHITEQPEPTEVDPPAPAHRPAHLLLALALGCAAVLAWYAAFPLTDGLPAARADDYGTAAWFPRALAVGAAVVLVLSMGRRGGALAAGVLAALAGVIGLADYLTWRHPEVTNWPVPTPMELRPAAPLALALMCGAVVLLCVPLALRRRPWFGTAEAAAGRAGAVRRRIQQVMVLLIVGCLLGGVLGGAGSLSAALVRGERETLTLPPQEVRSVPEERLYDGALRTHSPTVWPKGVPSERAWEREFDSPVALSTCEREGEDETGAEVPYHRDTVVGVDDDLAAEGASVIGVDARTGKERWRYTVPTTRHATVEQVGVSEDCGVLVLVDNSVTTLDAFDGSVRGRLLLSSLHLSEQTNSGGGKAGVRWAFITSTRHTLDDEGNPPRVVPLPGQDYAYLLTPKSAVLAVRKSDGSTAAVGFDDDACGHLVHGRYSKWGQTMVAHDCRGEERLRSFGIEEHDGEGETTPLLYGKPQMSSPVPTECGGAGSATAAVEGVGRLLVLYEGCPADRRGAWWVTFDPEPWRDDPMVRWERWTGYSPRIREATQPVHTHTGFVLPHRDGMLVVHDFYRKPSDTRVVPLPGRDPAVAFAMEEVQGINSDRMRDNGLLVLGGSGKVHAVVETITGANEFKVTDSQRSPVAPVTGCQGRTGLLAAHTSPTMLLTCTSGKNGSTKAVAYAGEERAENWYEPDE